MPLTVSGSLKLLLVLSITFSLSAVPVNLSNFHLPSIPVVRAVPAPVEHWYPAGPALDTLLTTIFTDDTAEFVNLQTASPSIDLTDSPLTPDLPAGFTTNPNFYITSPVSEHSYFEFQFMLGAKLFWGCDMNFGNGQCGIDIRQGIAHLIDKAKFVANEPAVKGIASAIDDPVPTNNGGLLSANPCAWDTGIVPSVLQPVLGTSLVQSGPNCIVGAPGGTAYHLAPASGATSVWQPSLSDLDMCAAAAHFIDAGLATGVVNPSTNPASRSCVLTGVTSGVTMNPITVFLADDDTARLHYGDSLIQSICALFTGSYTTGCGIPPSTSNIIVNQHGPTNSFTGFTTSTDHIDVSWHMYSAKYSNTFPFDSSLYRSYNSRFVSGISSIKQANGGSCSNNSVPTSSAADYMYLCNANYDNLSNQMENANCLTAEVGTDPMTGQTTPTFGTCTSAHAGGLSAISAGYQAEDTYGKGAYTLPMFVETGQYGYLSNWSRIINADGDGIPNYFTWLNGHSSNPAAPGTIRQGFASSTRSVNPYVSYGTSNIRDMWVLHNVYNSLHVINPMNSIEDLGWMDISVFSINFLTYTPPPLGVSTYRFTLMPNLQWQDGRPVTSFDIAFSYLSLLANGAHQSGGASSLAGVTVLSPTQFDLNLNSIGPFTIPFLTSLTMIPGRYWTCGGGIQPSTGTSPNIVPAKCPSTASSDWDNAIRACTSVGNSCYPSQYVLGTPPLAANCYPNAALPCAPPAQCTICTSFPTNLMSADATKTSALYDPIKDHIFIGSGPWSCGTGAGLGQNCAPGGIQNPGTGQSYTLQRTGLGTTPGFPGDYFRSSGMLASYLWSGDISPGVNNFSTAKFCYGAPPEPLTPSPPASACGRWQQGIGTNGATTPPGVNGCPGAPNTTVCGISVGGNQLSIIKLYININWVFPDVWNSASPPAGIAALNPLLYEGSSTLSPASLVGCLPPYPTGGYDC